MTVDLELQTSDSISQYIWLDREFGAWERTVHTARDVRSGFEPSGRGNGTHYEDLGTGSKTERDQSMLSALASPRSPIVPKT